MVDDLAARQTAKVAARNIADWISTPVWTASEQFLSNHASQLLTDVAESILAQLVGQHPEFLLYLGLLGVARRQGIEASHALLQDPGTIAPLVQEDTEVAGRLALALLAAGISDRADPQYDHAVAALTGGAETEAIWPMRRCRSASPSCELERYRDSLQELAADNPTFDLDGLWAALDAPSDQDTGG